MPKPWKCSESAEIDPVMNACIPPAIPGAAAAVLPASAVLSAPLAPRRWHARPGTRLIALVESCLAINPESRLRASELTRRLIELGAPAPQG